MEPGEYPESEEDATAEVIAKHVTRALQYACNETWGLLKCKDDDGRAIYMNHLAAKVANWALVYALREFAKVDRPAADWTARQVWAGWDAGDSIHEFTYEWAREYGLPEVKGEDGAVSA